METMNCIRNEADEQQLLSCKTRVIENQDALEDLANVLEIAGNTVRLKMIFLLSKEKELCVCDLSDILSMKISAVSQHLRKMKDRKIIQ